MFIRRKKCKKHSLNLKINNAKSEKSKIPNAYAYGIFGCFRLNGTNKMCLKTEDFTYYKKFNP